MAAPLECASCGSSVPAESRFCTQCGTPMPVLTGQGTPPEGSADPALGADTPGGSTPAGDTPGQRGDLMLMTSWRHVAQHLQAVLRGEFVIEREIGRGGMAAVYLARELRLNRRVALKVMSPSLLTGHSMVERFRQEAVTVANLSHANIVTVHSVRDIDDLHFFVMKFVDGRALDRIVADQRRLPLAVVRSILFQVGSALSYAHRNGVVHRDIKPANILIDKNGDAIVTDFGIAKVAESSAHTQTGVLIGTPTYMSPEQCAGLPVSAASDQYALGIVAYEMLTGSPPFSGPGLSVLQAHIGRQPAPIEDLAPDCPPEVARAVARMLAKDPADRWPTIGQAVAALGGGPLAEDDPLRETLGEMAGAAPLVAPTPPPPPPPPVPGAVRVTLPEGDWEVGDALQATAAVAATDGTSMPEVTVRWESDPVDVASVDESGRLALRAPGTVTVRALAGEVLGEATLDVAPARPATIDTEPPPSPMRVGESWRPVVTVRDRRGATLDVPVTLESTDPAVVRVADGGDVEPLAVGTASLRVSVDDLSSELPLAVIRATVAALEITASESDPELGDRTAWSARALDRRGRPVGDAPIRWRSSDPRVATVDDHGRVEAVGVGHATISAAVDGQGASMPVHVRRPAVAGLELDVPATALLVGEQVQLRAVARGRRGEPLDRPVRWTSADPSVLEVSATGIAVARAAGTASVTAECEAQRESADLAVITASITELFRPEPTPVSSFEPPPAEPPPAEPALAEPALAEPALAEPALAEPALTTSELTPRSDPTPIAAPIPEPAIEPPSVVAPVDSPPAAPSPVVAEAPAYSASDEIHAVRDTRPSGRRVLVPAAAATVLLLVVAWFATTRRSAPTPAERPAPTAQTAKTPATPVVPDSAPTPQQSAPVVAPPPRRRPRRRLPPCRRQRRRSAPDRPRARRPARRRGRLRLPRRPPASRRRRGPSRRRRLPPRSRRPRTRRATRVRRRPGHPPEHPPRPRPRRRRHRRASRPTRPPRRARGCSARSPPTPPASARAA
ncbi:protein kinase [Gemmatirosa kalamazoonensis]|uniref:non-specific serine/threonine protein kinase n=2 Tax=Gemmatirosa kalamazoonensis TaxID=861299 RepID=W0RIJ0_9BACT|nr:protein kinase [Gemmatirosa kalamazoonensis]